MSIFTSVPPTKLRYNNFNIGNINNLTMDAGQNIPIYIKRLYPGDKIRGNSSVFVEFMPMISPVRAEFNVYVHHFFVPFRLIWDDFEDFITGGRDGSLKPDPPVFNISALMSGSSNWRLCTPGSLLDYLGFPTITSRVTGTVYPYFPSILKARAYQQIFNDYYIDENLSNEVNFPKSSGVVSGVDLINTLTLRYRAWNKDYFTSALPFTQRGQAVQVSTAETLVALKSRVGETYFVDANGTPIRDADITTSHDGTIVDANGDPIYFDPNGTLGINGGLFSIEDLRNYTAVQRFLELNARGGSRYIEQILSHFGVVGKDARLQRAEYIAGSKTPVLISSVRQTSATEEDSQDPSKDSYLGEQSGIAVSSGGQNGFVYKAYEHGLFMSICSIIPKAQYFQGFDREDLFTDKLDWYWPEFQHLGEQAIKSSELFFDPANTAEQNDQTFGYAPRYAELKTKLSECHGQFRTSLLHWHVGRNFALRPSLNDEFVRVKPEDVARIFAVKDTRAENNHMLVTVVNDMRALRPLLKNPIPKLL